MQPDDFRKVKGRCISCGYLSKRARSGRVYEFMTPDRFLGKAFLYPFPGEDGLTLPHCLRRGTNFIEPEEGIFDAERMSPELEEAAAAAAFLRERGCPKWYPYREGLSPQGHLEEQRDYEFEERREAFELKVEQERRDFEEKMEGGRRNFEVAMVERGEGTERRHRTVMFRVGIVGVILIAIEILAVVFGAGPGSLLGDLLGR